MLCSDFFVTYEVNWSLGWEIISWLSKKKIQQIFLPFFFFFLWTNGKTKETIPDLMQRKSCLIIFIHMVHSIHIYNHNFMGHNLSSITRVWKCLPDTLSEKNRQNELVSVCMGGQHGNIIRVMKKYFFLEANTDRNSSLLGFPRVAVFLGKQDLLLHNLSLRLCLLNCDNI